MKIMQTGDSNIDVNAFNTLKEELKQLKINKKKKNKQTNHCLAKVVGIISNSTQVETLHDVIIVKNELIKSLQETIEYLKAQR